jgi:hypothetical protein
MRWNPRHVLAVQKRMGDFTAFAVKLLVTAMIAAAISAAMAKVQPEEARFAYTDY